MKLSEILQFVQAFRDFGTLGSLAPTSRYAAQALIREVKRRTGPRRILEVGPGTGAVTRWLARELRPGDHLTLCEINPDFVAYLRRRFEREPAMARVRDQVDVVEGSVLDLQGSGRFDFIVSVLPLNSMPTPLVAEILPCYERLLAPGGMLSYLEYAWLRRVRLALRPGDAGLREANDLLERFLQHEVYRDVVYANFTPAWLHHLRFDPPRPEEALALRPEGWRRRIALGPVGVNFDALGFAAGLGGLAALARAAGRRLWAWPLVLAGGTTAFLRDPCRRVRLDPEVAWSACDGRVLAVERLRDPHLGDGEWLRISTFLSITDVHVNRMPVAGVVARQFHVPGGARPAMLPGAEGNHSCYTVLDTVRGPVAVAQRVGLVARRIVNWVGPGELVAQGERFGLIRMGSRTDVYLPVDLAEPLVQPGQKVVAGLTPVARYTAGPRAGDGPR